MSFERCVGLEIGDEALYQQYRDEMGQILFKYEGSFRYDFRVSEVLKSESPLPINRLFIIKFKDKATHDAFFSDPEYKKIREKYFKGSVLNSTMIGGYDRIV